VRLIDNGWQFRFGRTVLTPTQRFVDTNGVRLRVTEAGDREAPVVILAHGFPDLAYSWRHQIPALADAGFHVLAPDQRGYGGSSCPAVVDAYDITALTADLVGLLDDIDVKRAVWVGHDLGAMVAWSAAQLHPDRVAAVVGMSLPPMPRGKLAPLQGYRKMVGENFFYILYFQQPGVADAELDSDPARSMRLMLSGLQTLADPDAAARMFAPGPMGLLDRLAEPEWLPDWISTDELDHYVTEFSRTGFTGALNWYRNFDRNWEIMANPVAASITAPALFIAGTADPVLMITPRDRATEVVTGPYRQVMIDGAGHWLQEERPNEVNTALLGFLLEVGS
jgi:pimeloyl-ACP methyl ester carboxylesterase